MISHTSLLFYINAAVEAPAILLLLMILFSLFFRKTQNKTQKAFGLFVLDLVLLLSCNMPTWILDGMFVSPTNLPKLYTLDLVLTTFDFFFYCLASVMFLNYVCILTGWLAEKKRRRLIYCLIAYCFVAAGMFTTSMETGWLYYFPEDGYTYYTPAYIVFVALSIPAFWLSYIAVFKSRKQLKKKVIPLFTYLIATLLIGCSDQVFSLSISYVCMAFIAMSIYIGVDVEQDHELLVQSAEINKRKAENTDMNVKLMVSQIQPHFLYNTLGTIYQLCGKDVKLAQETIKSFTKYLRTNMESLDRNTLVSFEKELEHTKTYLSIELLRFSDVLKVEYDINDTNFELPALTLQPLVENAVKHGIRSRVEGGTVTITAKRDAGKVLVSVRDDGMGYDTSKLPDDGRAHIGVANVRKRLEYMCGGKLEVESEIGVGTTATIVLEDVKNESTAD